MKKFLLTATMLVGFVTVAQAQQGRVGINTQSPAATLDVVATTTDNTRPDALLVPRMTRTQLYNKDGAYLPAQDGALVFVTTIDGTATTKTANVTASGFYYYDGRSTNTWIAVGGGTPPATVTNVTAEQTGSYTATATDDIILLNVNAPGSIITLPTTGVPVGKKLYISNKGSNAVDISPAPRETSHTQIQPADAGLLIYIGGTSWSYQSGF
jgi:hypothetical protein